MNYLMVLGREPKISLAELEALFSSSKVKQVAPNLAIVTAHAVSLDRLGGTVKAGQIIDTPIQDYLSNLPAGKITLGISDYSEHAACEPEQKNDFAVHQIHCKRCEIGGKIDGFGHSVGFSQSEFSIA